MTAAVLMSACSLLELGGDDAEPRPVFVPGDPAPPELVEPLGSILVLHAYSGPFRSHEERSEHSAPDVVVFDDGLVVANTALASDPENIQSVQLTGDELAAVVEILRTADLTPFAAGSGAVACADCPTTVMRVKDDGQTIEIAAEGLLSYAPARWTRALPYPRSLLAVDAMLSDLVQKVELGPSEPFVGDLPRIPVAQYSGG